MADRVKIVERIAARGRRKLEKRDAKIAEQEATMRRAALAEIAAVDAKLAKRAERRDILRARALRAARRGPPTTEQVLAKLARRAKAAERREYRKRLAQERLASLPAQLDKRADAVHAKVRGAAERAALILSRAEAIGAAPITRTPQKVSAPRRILKEEERVAKREAEFAAAEAIFAKQRAKDAATAAKRLPPLPY